MKEKATFNLSIKLLNELDDLWMKMRKDPRLDRPTKTDMVECAIALYIKNESENYGKDQTI